VFRRRQNEILCSCLLLVTSSSPQPKLDPMVGGVGRKVHSGGVDDCGSGYPIMSR
jgi:hypothetical protein